MRPGYDTGKKACLSLHHGKRSLRPLPLTNQTMVRYDHAARKGTASAHLVDEQSAPILLFVDGGTTWQTIRRKRRDRELFSEQEHEVAYLMRMAKVTRQKASRRSAKRA